MLEVNRLEISAERMLCDAIPIRHMGGFSNYIMAFQSSILVSDAIDQW